MRDYAKLVEWLRADVLCTYEEEKHMQGLAADAIEALQRACSNYAEQNEELQQEYDSIAESFNEAVELLHNRQPKWIPVNERLPRADRAEQVLINLHYPDGSNEVSLGEHWNCPDIPEEDGWGGFGGNGVVTHWMPLPEPPKGDEA